MFENLEAALWCIALVTWLTMFSVVVHGVAKKLLTSIRGRFGRQVG